MDCPICFCQKSVPFFNDDNEKYSIVKCTECGHVYLLLNVSSAHVADVYSDHYFNGYEDGYPDYINLKNLLIKRGEYYSKIVEKLEKPRSMLDVGCGAGFIMRGFQKCGWLVNGVEPNESMAEYGRTELHLDISSASFESYVDQKKYDLVCMIQVIAHFYDIRACLENVVGLLKKDGLLLIETWNRESFTARLLGKSWHEYSPPSVLNWFTPSSLEVLLQDYGLYLLESKRTYKKIQMQHAKSLLLSKSGNSVLNKVMGQIINILPDRVEFIYPADDLFYMILKKA